MTTRWRPDFNPDHLYFVTTTAIGRRHLFKSHLIARLLVDSLDMLRLRDRMKLYALVIMPNHIHLVAQFRVDDPLADVMRDYKRHTADRVIRQMSIDEPEDVGKLSIAGGEDGVHQYKVWEDGYLAKEVFSPGYLVEKMEYVHFNPCREHWRLSDLPQHYQWSSARFYLTEDKCIIPVDDARQFLI